MWPGAAIRKEDAMNKQTAINSIISTSGVFVAQHITFDVSDVVSEYPRVIGALTTATGKTPLPGITYGFDFTVSQIKAAQTFLVGKGHSIILIDCMPNNPWTGGNCWDTSTVNMPNLTTSAKWLAWLNSVAECLLHLKSLGGVALLDFLDECTLDGNCWWDWGGCGKTPAPFVTAWRHAYQYLAAKGVDNAVWCYCTADCSQWPGMTGMWPGDDVVDMATFTIYRDSQILEYGSTGYNALVAKGKPVGVFGVGPGSKLDGSFNNMTYINSIAANYPAVKFFQVWHSWPNNNMAIVDNVNSTALMQDARVRTQEDITTVEPPPPPPPPPASLPTAKITATWTRWFWWRNVTLTWSTTNAVKVVIDNGIGTVAASGSKTLWTTPKTFKVTATNADGKTATAAVRVG
jgi:hypothetical protein